MIGTPFKSDDSVTQRKVDKLNKKPWEQEVRDENGRRRFHGAFTGGFSAGYFNTCGSEKGFTPTSFVSSRSSKANLNQNVMDYMDEDDIKDIIGTHTISTQNQLKDYDVFDVGTTASRSIIPGPVINEFLPSNNNMIGNKLMLEAGFDESKKKYRVEVANVNLYYKGRLEFKANFNGIGYVRSNDEILEMKKKDLLSNPNRISMNKAYDYINELPLGEDDGYLNEVVELEEDNNRRNVGLERTKNIFDNQNVPSFVKSSHTLHMNRIHFDLPVLPQNYDPFNKNKSQRDELPKESNIKQRLNPKIRGNIIEEKFEEKAKLPSNVEKNVEKIEEFDNPTNKSEQLIKKFNFKVEIPFKNDLSKLSRFAKYVAEKEGLFISEVFFDTSHLMTGSQIREENKLYEKLYDEDQQLKKLDLIIEKDKGEDEKISEIKEKVEEIKKKSIKRETSKWIPDKLLCKRFKIADPYKNLIQTNETKASNLTNSFKNADHSNKYHLMEGFNTLQAHLMKEEGFAPNKPTTIKEENNEKNLKEIVYAKPDLSLFEQIFN